jgi:organic hydroperoxide reductase OsmC/OhrA
MARTATDRSGRRAEEGLARGGEDGVRSGIAREDLQRGLQEKNAKGKLAVTRVELRPRILFSGDKQPTQADLDWLHDKAHRECFIANSVTTEVRVAPPD